MHHRLTATRGLSIVAAVDMLSLAPGGKAGDAYRLATFMDAHRRLFVLGGAGCSTGSGIPDYRDRQGHWRRRPPVTIQAFLGDEATRRRYWARSFTGWPAFHASQPNRAHRALAALEAADRLTGLVTQNVDALHQRAGSQRVIDLHGRLDKVRCLRCDELSPRQAMQQRLSAANPDWKAGHAPAAPDGDADLEDTAFEHFVVPDCEHCGGWMKPDVVFFGENVPAARVTEAMAMLRQADAMLIVGSSLMVYSGYRFALAAAQSRKPIVALNLGVTRADALLDFKIERDCGEVLWQLAAGEAAAACATGSREH